MNQLGRWAPQAARAAAISILLLCSACATTTAGQRQTAIDRLNLVWGGENAAIRAEFGERSVNATPDQSYRAAKAALNRIGLEIDEDAAQPPTIFGRRSYAAGSFSWSPAVRQAEEARVRETFVAAVGPMGATLVLNPLAEELTGTATVKSASKSGTRVAVDFRSASGACVTACLTEMPPTALRSAFYQFWTAFDEEIIEVKADDEAKEAAAAAERAKKRKPPARAPRKPAAPKPPTEWTPPPRDWKPPPK
jgi:hypothetical protein